MAASKTIGGINVTISATTQKFQAGLTKARKLLVGFTRSIKNAIFSMKGFAAALAGAAGVTAFTMLTKNAFEAVGAMDDMSKKLGVSTDQLYGLQLAAEEAGVSQTVLERALVKLSTSMGMDGGKALRIWIADTAKLKTHHERLAAATAMFGARGADMVRFLVGGTAALDEAQLAAEGLGFSLSGAAVAGVDRALESFARLKKSVQGIFANLAVQLAPFLDALSTKLSGFVTQPGKIAGLGKTIADAIISTAKLVADGIQKMVGAGLSAFAELATMIHKFRSSNLGLTLGFGYDNGTYGAEYRAGRTGAAGMRRSADAWNSAAPWSNMIDDLMNSARAAAAKQAVQTAAGGTVNIAGKSANLGGINKSGPASLLAEIAKAGAGVADRMGFGLGAKPTSGMAPSLTLAESGSVESYRQQAAIQRQGISVQAKTLKAQTKAVVVLEKIERKLGPPVLAANF